MDKMVDLAVPELMFCWFLERAPYVYPDEHYFHRHYLRRTVTVRQVLAAHCRWVGDVLEVGVVAECLVMRVNGSLALAKELCQTILSQDQ